ncbi:hypothetical protein BH11PLA2_BH11PLA2_15130 [soil metagenome]
MSDDDAFLRAIHELAADHTRRLIYADYLEEQDNETANFKAEYLRLECELERLEHQLQQLQRRLLRRAWTRIAPARKQQLLRRLDEIFHRMKSVEFEIVMASEYDWLMALDVGPVKHCLKFQFQCPKRWDQLEISDATKIRFCPDCQKSVFYASSYSEAAEHALRGECVAINSNTLPIY